MITGKRRELLDAIIANPGDDLARLVYADHLDDVGQPFPENKNASFIRQQVYDYQNGQYAVKTDFGYRGLPIHVEMKRGFVFRIKDKLEALVKYAPYVFIDNPVEYVTVTDAVVGTLTASGGLRFHFPTKDDSMIKSIEEFLADMMPKYRAFTTNPGELAKYAYSTIDRVVYRELKLRSFHMRIV